jgi:hypothetical protein
MSLGVLVTLVLIAVELATRVSLLKEVQRITSESLLESA